MANLSQSMSRSLKEEMTDIPAQIEVVPLKHPELPPGGVGETSSRSTAAAIANAIFDATGVHVHRAPFTPARVKAAPVKA